MNVLIGGSHFDEEQMKRQNKERAKVMPSPDEVERCNCFCKILPVQGRHCVVCNHTHAPQPTGGVEDVAQAWIDKWVDPHLGFINWTNGHNSLTALLAAERTKSYEAGVRESLNNIKQLDTDWREYRGSETKAEFVLRRLAELRGKQRKSLNYSPASAVKLYRLYYKLVLTIIKACARLK